MFVLYQMMQQAPATFNPPRSGRIFQRMAQIPDSPGIRGFLTIPTQVAHDAHDSFEKG
jgi:hypothetical protein